MDINVLGIDLAKNSMQLHGINEQGEVVLQKKISRNKFSGFMANLKPCLVGMEACGGANHWARIFKSYGHDVRLMHPMYVKPYVKTHKNDANDAEAISEAVTRPNMYFVPIKNIEQQDVQTLHRMRQQLVGFRTATVNQIRGLLGEYGIVIPKNIENIAKYLPIILDENNPDVRLTPMAFRLFQGIYERLKDCEQSIKEYDKDIEAFAKSNERCKKLVKVEGVGPMIASAITTVLSDTKLFKNARQFSAYLGLVPKQHSTGGKTTLRGISKRGNRYMRTLLIHGARSVVSRTNGKTDARSRWINHLKETRGFNKACVALANKNARIIWAMLDNNEDYRKCA